jgi:hypothetical protein
MLLQYLANFLTPDQKALWNITLLKYCINKIRFYSKWQDLNQLESFNLNLQTELKKLIDTTVIKLA